MKSHELDRLLDLVACDRGAEVFGESHERIFSGQFSTAPRRDPQRMKRVLGS